MGRKATAMLNNMVEVALRHGGIAIMEAWKCSHCKVITFCYHCFRESIPCGNCGHRIASGLEKYRTVSEVLVDQK